MMKMKMKGEKEVRAALKKATRDVRDGTARAIYVAANVVMTEAKRRAPIDLGILRNSGYVTLPTSGGKPTVELGFGGAAADYALVQHERIELKHETGEAKFLENAINSTPIKEIVEEEMTHSTKTGDVKLPTGLHRTEPE